MHKKTSTIERPWRVLQRLLRYIRPVYYFFMFSLISFAVAAGANAGLIWSVEKLIEILHRKDFSQAYYSIPLMVIIFALARALGNMAGQFSIQYLGRYLILQLRQALFDHILYLPKKFFDQHTPSYISTRFSYHMEQIADTVANAVADLLREGLLIIALLIYIFYLNWVLSLIFLFSMPVIALVIKYTSRRLQKLSLNIQDSMAEVSHLVTESVAGHTVIRLFSGHTYEQQRFARVNERNYRQGLKRILTEIISTNLVHMILGIATAGLIFMALLQASYTNLVISEFVAFITAAGMLVKPVKQLSQVNILLQRGISAAYDLFKILDMPSEKEQYNQPEKNQALAVRGRIEFRHVDFAYTRKKVLKNISFVAEPGQLVALVGRSGSGKSTLISLLPQFYHQFSGSILVDNQPIQTIGLATLRKKIAYVGQNTILFHDTLANNIAYGSLHQVDRSKIAQAARLAQAMSFIEQLPERMDTRIGGEDGVVLSAGQAQRIAIARALLKDAPVLILDEPTSALDNESEHAIKQALNIVMQNRTCFVIAHRLSTIQQADLILVMQDGQIIESGKHEALLNKPSAYQDLYNRQFDAT